MQLPPPPPPPPRPVPAADIPRPKILAPPQVTSDGKKGVQPSADRPGQAPHWTYTTSPFFTNSTQPVASTSKHTTLASERFLSPLRTSTAAAPAADNDSFEVKEELLREDPSTDFGDDSMVLDDALLQEIDRAEKVALQDKGKGKGKARADDYTSASASARSEPSSSSGSRTTASFPEPAAAVSRSTIAGASSSRDAPVTREIITIDEEDDFDSMFCSVDEDFFEDFEKENPSKRRKIEPPPDDEIILISDSD